MIRRLAGLAAAAAVVVVLPLAGVLLTGLPVERYLEFPPQTRYVFHAPFSLPVFAGYTLLGLAALLTMVAVGVRTSGRGSYPAPIKRPFPRWGWCGVAGGLVFWLLAWNRFAWCAPFQAHTFFPLWVSYVIAVNGLCYRQSGRSMLTHQPCAFIGLFPLSAAFWWLFEYLNRYVQNWYYLGSTYGPTTYFLLATLSFSTVLPAVLATRDWLLSTRIIRARFTGLTVPRLGPPGLWAAGALIMAGVGLAGIGALPNLLFPLLWVSPLLIMVGIRQFSGKPHALTGVGEGEWRPVVAAALAALVCGGFWEMWNIQSLAKWIYSIPYMQRHTIFEMPLPGYAGYLPFGLACAMVAEWIFPGLRPKLPDAPSSPTPTTY